ncbi:MAG: hypothetical protein AAF702_31925 [Chloroflexota bacterium]
MMYQIRRSILWVLLAIMGLLLLPMSTVYAQGSINSSIAAPSAADSLHLDSSNVVSPIVGSPLYGNYCTALGGVSLNEEAPVIDEETPVVDEGIPVVDEETLVVAITLTGLTNDFTLNVPGTPMAAYWFWSGRSTMNPQLGDDTIDVAANGYSAVELTADQSLAQPDGSRTWHTYLYNDSSLATVQSGLNEYTVSGLNINGRNEENHGAALLVVYEDEACPYQKIDLNWGLDSLRLTQLSEELGPDSALYCQELTPSSVERALTVGMIVGGIDNDMRGNSLWTLTGSGVLPTGSITPDDADNPSPGSVFIDDPFNNNPGPEWDLYTTSITVPAGDTYACFQIESKVTEEDPYGISAVLQGFVSFWEMVPPAIDIQKTPDIQTVVSGSDVPFTIRVENTGSLQLDNVTVTDPLAPACDRELGTMMPGDIEHYECTLPEIEESLTNVASVVGQPIVGLPVTDTDQAEVIVIRPAISIEKTPDIQMVLASNPITFTITVKNSGDVTLTNVMVIDALVPACDINVGTLGPQDSFGYDCQLGETTGSFTNVALVSGQPPVGDKVEHSDEAAVSVIHPAINIQKSPDTQSMEVGQPILFTIMVQNSGDVALTDVAVLDEQTPACDYAIGDLAINEIMTYSCQLDAASESFTNVAQATGKSPINTAVQDEDEAQVIVLGPAIDIQKTPDLQTIPSGSSAQFTITVTNIGDTPLTNVTITDTLVPACNQIVGDMAVDAIHIYSCTLENVTDDLINIAQVSGYSPARMLVEDHDSATVKVGHIRITKSPDTPMVVAGSAAYFTIEVMNTGNVTLSNVRVTDPLTPQCDIVIGTLTPGLGHNHTCAMPKTEHSFTNTASVVGDLPGGAQVNDDASAAVTVIHPAIVISKTPDLQTVLVNTPVTFTIRVKNAGDIELSEITVTDPHVPTCDATFSSLAPNEYVEYKCRLNQAREDFTNIATVTGKPPVGIFVFDEDEADVDVIAPSLSIQKLPDTQMVRLDGTAYFTIVIKNEGDTPLFEVAVTDELSGDCNRLLGDLGPGDARTYFCEAPNIQSDFVNVARVVGSTVLDTQLIDSDDAAVDVIHPAIEIAKTAQNEQIGLGETAVFEIQVKNEGDVALTNVTVRDQRGPDCNRDLGTLSAGEIVMYNCEMPNIQETTINIASVSGVPPVGLTVQDEDSAEVQVPKAKVTITKQDDVDVAQPNDFIHYTLTYENEGPGDAFDVFIIEVVPDYTSFVATKSSDGWVCEEGEVAAGTACRYDVGDLASASGARTVQFAVQLDSVIPSEVEAIFNEATIDGVNFAPSGASTVATERTPVIPTALETMEEPDVEKSGLVAEYQIFVPVVQR